MSVLVCICCLRYLLRFTNLRAILVRMEDEVHVETMENQLSKHCFKYRLASNVLQLLGRSWWCGLTR